MQRIIQKNVQEIRTDLENYGKIWGAVPQLVAVTKTQPAERINALLPLGVLDIGENRVQEWMEKREAVDPSFRLHLIGRLQSNKVKYIIDRTCLIHSLDRSSLAEEISRRAVAAGRRMPVLVEVNISGEESKAGLAPAEVLPFMRAWAGAPGLMIQGLMTVLPRARDPEEVRPLCRDMRALFEQCRAAGIPGADIRHLSMGMSEDYRVAAQEGATLVRIGTGIFGRRA